MRQDGKAISGEGISQTDLAVREPFVFSYLIPAEISLETARELPTGIVQTSPGPRRPIWPWAGGDGLVVSYKYNEETNCWSPRKGECLSEFTRLAEVPEDDFAQVVLAFARRWGPLGICPDLKPTRSHLGGHCGAVCDSTGRYTEPVEAWRRYSRQLRAILSVAEKVQNLKPGSEEDWAEIENAEPSECPWIFASDQWGRHPIGNIVADRRGIARALENWFRYGGVGLRPYWQTDSSSVRKHRLEIRTTYEARLAGRLAVDLAAALRSPHGIYRCAGCGLPFSPEGRRRARDREKWCSSQECKREQLRRNSKRYYEKRNAKTQRGNRRT